MQRLDDLESLDRKLLHIFVAGPGFGEGVAVALPGSGWLLLDGCRTSGPVGRDLPLVQVVRTFASDNDPVRWMILTHPHEDHAAGFAEAVDVLRPQQVGITGLGRPERHVLDEARSWTETQVATSSVLKQRQVLAAFRRLTSDSVNLRSLHAGIKLDGFDPKVTITVRAPLKPALRRLFKSCNGNWLRLRSKANSLSLVLEIEFGASRVVLGADMITQPDRKTGWKSILNDRPELGSHIGLKIPHHGSKEAQERRLMVSQTTEPAWWLTPFSRASGGPLPRPDDDLKPLCRAHQPLRLTVMPTRKARQQAGKRTQLTVDEYRDCLRSPPASGTFLTNAIEVTPPEPLTALEPIWAAAFDNKGQVRDHYAGTAAVSIFA